MKFLYQVPLKKKTDYDQNAAFSKVERGLISTNPRWKVV
jgi:hypothetical protein